MDALSSEPWFATQIGSFRITFDAIQRRRLSGHRIVNSVTILERTILGSFLRQSSLDELPQLINILRGEMSFVGPRPIVAEELQKYGEWTSAYLSVRPGLTGLWQISGRSDCSYEERIAFDVSYIRNRNFRGDLAIILRTIPAVLSRKGSV